MILTGNELSSLSLMEFKIGCDQWGFTPRDMSQLIPCIFCGNAQWIFTQLGHGLTSWSFYSSYPSTSLSMSISKFLELWRGRSSTKFYTTSEILYITSEKFYITSKKFYNTSDRFHGLSCFYNKSESTRHEAFCSISNSTYGFYALWECRSAADPLYCFLCANIYSAALTESTELPHNNKNQATRWITASFRTRGEFY